MALYQKRPLRKNNNPAYKNSRSFTASREAFRNKTFLEGLIHEHNPRVPNQEITLHYLNEFDVKKIKKTWKRMKRNLDRVKLQYIASIELTRGRNNRANGCVHYHFLFDTSLGRDELKTLMREVCLNSGLNEQHFSLDFPNDGITDWSERKIAYFTKNSKWKTVYLFEKGLRIRKFYHSKNWFLDKNGDPTTKTKIREQILSEHKQRILSRTLAGVPSE